MRVRWRMHAKTCVKHQRMRGDLSGAVCLQSNLKIDSQLIHVYIRQKQRSFVYLGTEINERYKPFEDN